MFLNSQIYYHDHVFLCQLAGLNIAFPFSNNPEGVVITKYIKVFWGTCAEKLHFLDLLGQCYFDYSYLNHFIYKLMSKIVLENKVREIVSIINNKTLIGLLPMPHYDGCCNNKHAWVRRKLWKVHCKPLSCE